jgi:diguanylate cyclase (GGDEF)-like protein
MVVEDSSESTAMPNTAHESSSHTFLSGKVIFNYGGSSIDCVVRRLSDEGATIELESAFGIPEYFHLLISSEAEHHWCKRVWQSDKQVGVTFHADLVAGRDHGHEAAPAAPRSAETIVRGQMLALRAALDHVPVGILLLDANLKSQFINRACRKMWALSDALADRNPPFVAIMYHGRDINAYEISSPDIDAYIAERIRLVRAGDPTPLNLRKTNGEVIRMQCTSLPDGGRMLSYTLVTDIVRYADELEVLRDALENVQDGIVLLDADMNARFVNASMRAFWEISDEQASGHPSYASLVSRKRRAVPPDLAPEELDSFAAKRVAEVKAGDNIRDMQTPGGHRIRAHCTTLVGGGRMLTYCDISDLTHEAEELKKLATIDSLTGISNRRHFLTCAEAEWSRFQRYNRSVSVLMLDLDNFKSINDRYGHGVGDEVIRSVAEACLAGKRKPDIVGRYGGDEFAILLPETSLSRAEIVAERIRNKIAAQTPTAHKVSFKVTASIGVAEASVGMADLDFLMRAADQALYQAKANGRNRIERWSAPDPAMHAAE